MVETTKADFASWHKRLVFNQNEEPKM